MSKPKDPSSSSSAQKEFDSYFVPVAENAKVLNQSEPRVDVSRVLKKQ